jgi:hypothetical protein
VRKLCTSALTTCLAAIILLSSSIVLVKPTQAATTYGPRIDQLLCKIYSSNVDEFTAFQAGQVDIIDSPLTKTLIPVINSTAGLALDKFRQFGMFEFDINNNLTMLNYPNIANPCSDKNFRIAIAYLVDKPYTINTILGGFGVQLETPIIPWTSWYDPLMKTYPYDPGKACQTLFNNGWRDSPDPNNSTALVHFPSNWTQLPAGPNVSGEYLKDVLTNVDLPGVGAGSGPGLIFVRRQGADPDESAAGKLLIDGDATHLGLRTIGVPIDDITQRLLPMIPYTKNFHLYMGGWSLSRNPDYVYDLYNGASMNWNTNQFSFNYDNINDSTLNAATYAIKNANSFASAQTACHTFCDRWGQIEPMIPLWAPAGYYAHRTNIHVLNDVPNSIPSNWNLMCMNIPSVGVTGGTVNMGFASDVQMLNVINSQWVWDWQILDNVYDTLIRFNPLHCDQEMPWMAHTWTVGTWNIPSGPNAGGIGTRVIFTLASGLNFITPTNGAVYGAVTPADVAFSLQYTYGQAGWNSPALADCFTNATSAPWAANSNYQVPFITTTNNTVTVYFQHQSIWAVDWVGDIPIIPKTIFNTINDASGFYPGGDSNVQAMTGSGPYCFGSYNAGTSCLLLANRNFFKPIVPNVDTDPTHIHIDWSIFLCKICKTVPPGPIIISVLDLIVVATNLGVIWCPPGFPGDVNGDGKVNVLDLITVASCLGAHWDC